MCIINYHNITYPDMNNGSGLRVALWLSGCDHKCHGCQNQQTWDANSGIPFDEVAKQEIFTELGRDYISGLTLTGGDPLYKENLDDVLKLVKEVKILYPDKNIWIYTGYRFEDLNLFFDKETIEELDNLSKRQQIVRQCDVMIDGRYIEHQRDVSLKWCGSKNQRVINIKRTLEYKKIILEE